LTKWAFLNQMLDNTQTADSGDTGAPNEIANKEVNIDGKIIALDINPFKDTEGVAVPDNVDKMPPLHNRANQIKIWEHYQLFLLNQ